MFKFAKKQIVFLLVLLQVCAIQNLFAGTQDPNAIVATVNKAKVFYKDIEADPGVIQQLSVKDLNDVELEKMVHLYEQKRLAAKIHEIIFEQKIVDLGLTVSESEINEQVEKIFKETNMTVEEANKVCQAGHAVYEALKAWQKSPTEANSIYDAMLANTSVSRDQWKLFQACYDTAEKLKSLKVPQNIEQMKLNSRQSSKRDLYYIKLEDLITKNVMVTTDEITALYEKRYGKVSPAPRLEDVKELIESELMARKKQEAIITWWKKQYDQSDIQIKEKQFIDPKAFLYQYIPVVTR